MRTSIVVVVGDVGCQLGSEADAGNIARQGQANGRGARVQYRYGQVDGCGLDGPHDCPRPSPDYT
jgi:hypothetical protein